ncbi:1145_t:CDS:2 [Racocetra fulgida]|uniref:superoxide dismutase n=1 Tax=Racocetra fulgida TaxID=60492 RepID=A0A9N8VFS1_9GLOM|nr:1145_t:CDS:2 [Racocetra fulgida]
MNNYQRIKLPYELNELEWVISFKTMYYHYNILHKNYEVKLLETLRGTEIMEQFPTLENLMENLEKLPEEIKDDVRFFGGGLINHNFFFAHLAKFESEQKERERAEKISPDLLNLIQEKFGSLEKLKKELVKSALKVQHAYYLDYGANRKEYVEKLLDISVKKNGLPPEKPEKLNDGLDDPKPVPGDKKVEKVAYIGMAYDETGKISKYATFSTPFLDVPGEPPSIRVFRVDKNHPRIKELLSEGKGKLKEGKKFTIRYGKVDKKSEKGIFNVLNENNSELEIKEV